MSGKNKILIGCLALLLVLSVGYALFSETIVINGTATAKGGFELTTTCVKGLSNDIITHIGGDTTSETFQGGYSNDSCNVTNQRVDINVGTLKAGETKTLDYEVKVNDNFIYNNEGFGSV